MKTISDLMLKDKLTACLQEAVDRQEAAGISVLAFMKGRELCYAQAGMASINEQKPLARDSIFRLYSQTKPITAAAVMLLVERGKLDLMDCADRYLPGFRNPRVIRADGEIIPALRAPYVLELLGMTAGLSYPDVDPAGQYATRVFEEDQTLIRAGGGMSTVEFCNRLGELPLAFEPGTRWRYSTCADILGAIVETVSGKPFGRFLREELFEPLDMKDTAFWVPPEKTDRLVTVYRRTEQGLEEFHNLNLAVGDYSREPAFESGGAGLVSTLDDYMAFAQMLLNNGVASGGRRILSEAAVRYMRTPQLSERVRADMWDGLGGYSYSCLMRVCDRPGEAGLLTRAGEYGWDGWLGTYFSNIPDREVTFLLCQNVTDAGTVAVTRKCRNLLEVNELSRRT